MKTISTKRRYNFISIITFLVIALSFGYYYLIFVKNAENRFHDRAYRIIESVGKSIEKKQTNYHKIAQNALSFVSKYDHNIKTILHDNLQWEFYNDDYITSIPKLDSILKQKYGVPEELEFLYTYDFLEKFYFDSPDINKPDLGDSKTDILTLIGDYILFYISIDESIVYVKYHKEKLFNNTLRYDLFEEYFAFYEDSMIYDFAEKKDILVNLKLLYSESSTSIISPTTYGKYDSIIYNSQLLLKTSLLESKGGFTKDLTYLTPIDLNINRKAYLGGIINRDEFSKQTMRLNPIATTIFIVIMVLMIVMIPIIKIRLLSENERLNTSDSVLGFFAIVVSSAFIFMLILHQYSKKQTSEAFKQSILRTTAKDVEDLLIGEFDEILGNMELLDSYENIDTNKRDLLFKYDNHSENLLPDTNLITLTWINAGGDQLVKWREGIITPRVNVSHRTYFKKPFQKKTWSDNSIANGTGFFIESILSITDGDHYLVFGKQSQVDSSFADINPEFDKYLASVKYKNNQPSTIPSVVTLAVKRLKTFTNKYSPENLHLMLIDKSGDIIYHENKSKILQENLLTETQNNPNLLTALQNHSVNFFYSKYEVQDSYFHIRPVGSLPIYLVAYIDNDYEKTVSTQIFSLSSTLYFLLLFFIIFQVALFVLVDARWTIKTRGGNILFGWFWPNPHMNFV